MASLVRNILHICKNDPEFVSSLHALLQMFEWLIGETEVRKTDVYGPDGKLREQYSVVHIKKCRYLESSGCVSACLNLCKVPTQAFFTQEAGVPTTLEPDFSTLSCNIVFGQAPAAREADEAFIQPCFAVQCSRPSPDGLPTGHRARTMPGSSDDDEYSRRSNTLPICSPAETVRQTHQ